MRIDAYTLPYFLPFGGLQMVTMFNSVESCIDDVFTDTLRLGSVEIKGVSKEMTSDGFKRYVIDVEPTEDILHCCPHCGTVGKYYDTPRPEAGPKEWLSSPLAGNTRTVIRHKQHRIYCPRCGKVVVAAVPWASLNSGFTYALDEQIAWLFLHMNKEGIANLLGIDWDSVQAAIDRVIKRLEKDLSRRLNGLVKIGIDENAYGRGYKFILIVYNHVTQEVVWVKEGRKEEVLDSFFELLTPEQRDAIELVTCDGAEFIHNSVKKYCKNAKICLDTFHVSQWLTDDANEVRLDVRSQLEEEVNDLNATIKEINTDKSLNTEQRKEDSAPYKIAIANLKAKIELINKGKHLLTADTSNLDTGDQEKQKEFLAIDKSFNVIFERMQSFRQIMKSDDIAYAASEFEKLVRWAEKCPFESFNKRANTLIKFKGEILNTMKYKLTNGIVESTNNTIKVLIRRSYGFRNLDNLDKAIKFKCSQRYKTLHNGITRRVPRSDWMVCKRYSLKIA